MASRNYQTLMVEHARRASELADRFPAAMEVLTFYAALAQFQAEIFPRAQKFNALCLLEDLLMEFIQRQAPAALQLAASKLDLSTFTQSIADYWQRRDTVSPNSFFARAVLQPYAVGDSIKRIAIGENLCPHCGHLPQVAVLRKQGHGNAVNLVCSLCMEEWSFRRVCCPGCLEQDEKQIEFYSADEFDYFQVQMCLSCNDYILCVDSNREPAAIPFVDELAGLPLDVWAREQGFAKLQPNVAGI